MNDLNFAIYEKGKLTEILKPDHIGLIGIHITNNKYNYKKNSPLEIGLVWPDKTCLDEYRVPVTVSMSDSSGLALRLKDFDAVRIANWSNILKKVYTV